MKKSMKRIVSLLCLICVLVGCLPVKTYATDGTGSTGNEIIITCNDSTKVTVGGSWNTTKWSAVKPTDEQYLAGVEGIFGDDDLTYRTAKSYWIKFDLSAYSGCKYKLYFLNLNTGTAANTDSGLSTGTFSFRNGDTVVENTEFDPLANGNGEWITVGTYDLGLESSLFIQNTNKVKNFRVAAIKLVPVTEESDSVAQIEGGEKYETLEGAIEAAAEGATITLLYDCELPSSGYDKVITYDLNGHTLTCDAFTGVNATVVDSSDGNKGLLKIPQDKLVFDINNDNDGYIPVWDSESNGYRFSSVTISDIEYDSTDALVFAMRPAFDSSNIEKLVAAGHDKSMVRVGVRITWPGSDKPYDLPLTDDWLSTMYGDKIAKGVKLTISGGETITKFTATTIVWSEQCPYVVITGEKTHTYPATVAE